MERCAREQDDMGVCFDLHGFVREVLIGPRWYTSIMSSGGVALILYNLPYGFRGLWVLGMHVFAPGIACQC